MVGSSKETRRVGRFWFADDVSCPISVAHVSAFRDDDEGRADKFYPTFRVTYLNGTPLGTSLGWTILGAAIRTLQGFGGHRKITSKRLRASIVIEETFRRMVS